MERTHMTNLPEKQTEIEEQKSLFFHECSKMLDSVGDAVKAELPIQQVEQSLFTKLLVLGKLLLSVFVDSSGNGDIGETVVLNGHTLYRQSVDHFREYLSVFGSIELRRAIYAMGPGKKIELAPLDAQLLLPESKFSYLLQDWNQTIAREQPYNKVNEILVKILGLPQSTNTTSRIGKNLSDEEANFWDQAPKPIFDDEVKESLISVISADGKGIPIIGQDNTPEIFQGDMEKADGSKKGKKKMALLGSVYSIEPYIRTPSDIVDALFSEGSSKDKSGTERPKPLHKYIRASLLRDEEGTGAPSYKVVFDWLGQQHNLRNFDGERLAVVLMDGQKSLWDHAEAAIQSPNRVEILDLLHACSYVWDATHTFYEKNSDEAKKFAKKQIRVMLSGGIDKVIADFRTKGKDLNLNKKKLEIITKVCRYFENNKDRMQYHEYLAAGYPIASGIIEGACRYVVKDRMERTGMRWIMEGAQAMINLRSISASGFWDNYITFFIKQKSLQLYPGKAVNDELYGFSRAA